MMVAGTGDGQANPHSVENSVTATHILENFVSVSVLRARIDYQTAMTGGVAQLRRHEQRSHYRADDSGPKRQNPEVFRPPIPDGLEFTLVSLRASLNPSCTTVAVAHCTNQLSVRILSRFRRAPAEEGVPPQLARGCTLQRIHALPRRYRYTRYRVPRVHA